MKIIGWLVLIVLVFMQLSSIFDGLNFGYYEDAYNYYVDKLLFDLGLGLLSALVVGTLIINIGTFIKKKRITNFTPTLIWGVLYIGVYVYQQNYETLTPQAKYNIESMSYSLEGLIAIDYEQDQPVTTFKGYWWGRDVETGEPNGIAIHVEDSYLHVLSPASLYLEDVLYTAEYEINFTGNPGYILIHDPEGYDYSKQYIKYLHEDLIGVVADITEGVTSSDYQGYYYADTAIAFALERIDKEKFERLVLTAETGDF
ncbi:hypothetical protein CD30_16375 [Ureibacillus massiliensis 4400831 = CIP 108448 = CCUG 49529]|uniref:Uncharacterized protein n=1 Tax=Ureibacillus massiliensis 4400831 = CIP 108448 = CCUG 49529 TaxID=1211035 RepID=A0A0A3IXS0_9BACL|nr:hypothetical protein [Ureibacillus massiliensis]KGR89574.1 hypothetical protein CD30_16375 [Ureibacillus massiliensis 4400831 = CIP 108448 = CCUG 49529]